MKHVFKQFAEDFGYGMILPGNSPADKMQDTLAFYASVCLLCGGLIVSNPGFVFAGAVMSTAGVGAFAAFGKNVRLALAQGQTPRP